MAWFDLTGSALTSHTTATSPPADLRGFWDHQLALAAEAARPVQTTRHGADIYRNVVVEDITFTGGLGHPIRAWLILPAGDGPWPVIVQFLGYGGGRGYPSDHLTWPGVGFAVLLVDSRGQGGGWGPGDTGDPISEDAAAPQAPGVLTRGILNPETYYYTRMFADAARAVQTVVELAADRPLDANRIGVAGGSQGGALAIAAAALAPDHVAWLQAEMPFMADVARAVTLVDTNPYRELARYLALYPQHLSAVQHTLSYVDTAVLAGWVQAPTVLNVGLMDDVCPPSTAYAVFNAIGVQDKQIHVFEFVGHELPPPWSEERVRLAHAALGSAQ